MLDARRSNFIPKTVYSSCFALQRRWTFFHCTVILARITIKRQVIDECNLLFDNLNNLTRFLRLSLRKCNTCVCNVLLRYSYCVTEYKQNIRLDVFRVHSKVRRKSFERTRTFRKLIKTLNIMNKYLTVPYRI